MSGLLALAALAPPAAAQIYPSVACGNTYTGTFDDNVVVPEYPGATSGLLMDTFVLQVPVAQHYQVRGLGPARADIRLQTQFGVLLAQGYNPQAYMTPGSYRVILVGAWGNNSGVIDRSPNYAFLVACATTAFPTLQVIGGPTAIALGQRVQGTLAGSTDALRDYSYDINSAAPQGGTGYAGGYWPGADQAFSFSLPTRSLVRVAGAQGGSALGGFAKLLNGTATNTLAGGTPAGATNYTEAAAILEPGTRYLTIEQGSTTTGQPYDFTLTSTCIPTGGAQLATGLYRETPVCCGEQTYNYLSAPGYLFSDNAFPCTLGQALTLGLIDNGPGVPTPFVRVFLDLNRDGDFTDAGELVLPSTSLVGTALAFSLTLSAGSPVYHAAAGTRVPMRVQLASTALGGGPCDALPNGTTLDAFLQIAPMTNPFQNMACGQPVAGVTDGTADADGFFYDTLTFVHTEATVQTPSGPGIEDHYTELRFRSLNGHEMQVFNEAFEPLSGWAQSHDFSIIQNTYGRYYVRVKSPANLFGAPVLGYTLERSCHLRYPPNRYQYLNGPAVPLIANNQRVEATLSGQGDVLWRYEFVGNRPAAHMPGADRAYRFITNTATRTTIRNNAPGIGPFARHRMVLLNDAFTGGVVGLSAATNSPATNGGVFNAAALLPAGTYYVSVEQGSATASEGFDFTVKQACTPAAASPVQPFAFFFNGIAAAPAQLVNNTGYSYRGSPISLTVGQAMPISVPNGTALFNRVLADFNDDGQFDPATELIALSNAATATWTRDLLVSPFNVAARAAWGRQIGLRIQGSASSLATLGTCSNLAAGFTADFEVTLVAPALPPPAGTLGFTGLLEAKGSAGTERYTRVRLAPDGSMYGAGSFSGTTAFSNGTTAGQSFASAGSTDGMLVRYTPQGSLAWVCRFGSAGADEALGLGVDRLGNAYVCGYFTGSMTVRPAQGRDTTLTSAGGEDGFVARISPAGRLLWIFRTGAQGNDRNTAIDVTPNFRFYLAGSFVGRSAMGGAFGTVVNLTSRGNADAFLARFTEVGSMFWVVQVGGPGNDFGFGAATDASGNGYLLGSYEGTATYTASNFSTAVFSLTSAGGSDGFVASVDGNGNRRWVQEIKGPTNEVVRDVAMDPNGGALVAVGAFSNTAAFGPFTLSSRGFNDGFAFRLSTGTVPQVLWARRIGGFGQDRALGVRIDRQGNPIVTGNFAQTPDEVFGAPGTPLTSVGGLDGYVAKLERNSGLPLYLARFGGAGDEEPLSADTTAQGGALVAGSYQQTATFAPLAPVTAAGLADGFLVRYQVLSTPPPVGGSPLARMGAAEAAAAPALRVYPNPSTGRFWLAAEGPGHLQAYAADGRLVLDAPIQPEGPVEATLPPGIYQLRFRATGQPDRTTRLVVQ